MVISKLTHRQPQIGLRQSCFYPEATDLLADDLLQIVTVLGGNFRLLKYRRDVLYSGSCLSRTVGRYVQIDSLDKYACLIPSLSLQGLATGRIPSFSLPFIDCELPADPDETIADDGTRIPSCESPFRMRLEHLKA